MRAVPLLLLSFLAACVVDPKPDESAENCQRICARRTECPGHTSETECQESCVAAHYPSGCADAFEAATCSEIDGTSTSASFTDACYPACSPDGRICQGDTLAACTNSRLVQQDCDYSCKTQGFSYSGVCAATKNGTYTQSGLPECWCE